LLKKFDRRLPEGAKDEGIAVRREYRSDDANGVIHTSPGQRLVHCPKIHGALKARLIAPHPSTLVDHQPVLSISPLLANKAHRSLGGLASTIQFKVNNVRVSCSRSTS